MSMWKFELFVRLKARRKMLRITVEGLVAVGLCAAIASANHQAHVVAQHLAALSYCPAKALSA